MTDYGNDPEIVDDPLYRRDVEHGLDEFKPSDPEAAKPLPNAMQHELRESSHTAPGTFTEDESLMDVSGGRPSDEMDLDVDVDRKVASLVAASHREGRNPDEKMESAKKASDLHQKITGEPLTIDQKTGEVVSG